jgi:hypothetical protein
MTLKRYFVTILIKTDKNQSNKTGMQGSNCDTVNGNVIKINVDMYLDLGNSHWKNKNLPQMS